MTRPVPTVRIIHLGGPVLDALAAGDVAAVEATSPVPLPPSFTGPDWRGEWRMRSDQVRRDPASAAWVTGVIWDEDERVAVGRAGYHGPPDAAGMVEIGYAVAPSRRGRGIATAAAQWMIDRARAAGVEVVVAHTLPEVNASTAVLGRCGFVHVDTIADPDGDVADAVHRWELRLLDAAAT